MATDSVSGVNIKIGADLSELQKEVSKVGSTIEGSITPGQAKPVKDLAKDFKDVKDEARLSKVNIAAVASAVAKIGTALAGMTKGILEEAVKTNPETAQTVDDLKNSFNGIKAAIVEGVAPLIEKYGPQLTQLFDTIAKWIAEHPNLSAALVGIAGAIGLLAPAISTVLPFLTLFNISLAPISGTALLVVGGIAALVGVIALLNDTLLETPDHVHEFNGSIEEIDQASQHLTQGAYGDLVIEDYQYTAEGLRWDETKWNPDNMSFGAWVSQEEDLANAASLATDALTEQGAALTTVTDPVVTGAVTEEVAGTINEATSAADQAQKIYDDLVKSNGELAESTVASTDDINASIQSANELLSSETFQQFAQVPIDESVSSSWATFGESVNTAANGFSSLSTELDKNTAAGKITDIGGAAQASAGMFDALTQSINNTIGALKELATVNSGGGGKGGSTVSLAELRASGGPVTAGAPYVVGEAGPELFVPRTNGEIIPNSVYENITSRELVINTGPIYGESYLKNYVLKLMTGQIRRELRMAS